MRFFTSLFQLAFAGFLLNSCSNTIENKKSEFVSFGPAKVNSQKAISLEKMLSKMKDTSAEKEFTIKAKINEVCSAAGCWIKVKKIDGSTVMIRFKDHFTIPIHTEIGTESFVHGIAYWDSIPLEMLQHFAEDSGKSPAEIARITEPSFELAFEADGISIPKIVKPKK